MIQSSIVVICNVFFSMIDDTNMNYNYLLCKDNVFTIDLWWCKDNYFQYYIVISNSCFVSVLH